MKPSLRGAEGDAAIYTPGKRERVDCVTPLAMTGMVA